MAGLASLLSDPNYTGANAATKQAIFDKFAPQDPNFVNANPETQLAIRSKFGLTAVPVAAAPSSGVPTGPRATGTMVDQIPGYGGPVPAADNAPTLTTGQKIYRTVRPVIAPTVEALGTAGGAALGTFLGPAGTVGGAGLGYGIAKEGLEMADVAMGMKAPRQGAAQVVEPVRNVLEGATFEAGGRVAGQGLGYLGGKIADLRQIPTQKAAKIARNALGKDLPEVLNTLRNAPDNASVADLTAKIENPAWQALIKDALEKDPQFVRKARLLGERESRNVLAELAGGATAAETRATAEAAKNALNQTTTPLREAALSRANLGKDVAAFEAQAGKLSAEAAQEVADVRRLVAAGNLAEAAGRLELIKKGVPVGFTKYTYKGDLAKMADEWATGAANASLDLGQGARFAQGAADALRSVGIKPLEGAKISQSIAGIANKPEFAGNDLIAGAAKNVADDIAKWTGGGGVIDAVALDAIRKNSVNAAIQQLRPGVDATTQRNLAAGVLSKVKPLIDDALEAAGGVGYKQYLADYAKGSRQIAERKLTGEAARLWKTDKDAFVKLVQNESPDVVEKFLGPGNYNIAAELADTTMGVLQKQAEKRLTELSVKEQVSEGSAALSQLLKQQTSILRVPSFLNFWAAASNKTLSELEKAVGVKTLKTLTDAMKTPEGTTALLDTLPGSERVRVLKLISDPKSWAQKSAGAAIVGATNALAPANENQNALIGK
jgi:hypothetical protein